jgi:hypothetical protein
MSALLVAARPRRRYRTDRLVRPSREVWADRGHVASVGVGYVLLLGLLRGTWFRGDDFEFLANRVGQDRSLSIWYPHNEHWSSGPIAIWRVLYDAVGVDSALPYFACSLLAHVVAAHLLWRLMRHAGVDPWVRTGLACVYLFLGSGWENITWAFQLGFMGAFALGLGATLLCLHDNRRAQIGSVVLLLIALTFSGVAVPFAISSTLCLLLRRQVRRAVVLAVVTGATYAIWYAAYGRLAPAAPHTQGQLARLAGAATWAWQLLTNALEGLTSLTGLGGVLIVALAWYAALQYTRARAEAGSPHGGPRPWQNQRVLVLTVLLANVLLQTLSLAIGRNDISAPTASRYIYFVIALLLPLVGVALTEASLRFGRLLPLGVVAFLVLTQGVALVSAERQFESPQMRADVVGLAALLEQHRPVADTFLAIDLDTATIKKWVAEGALDKTEHVTDQQLRDAAALGLVSVKPSPETAAAGDVLVGDERLGTVSGACATATPPPGAPAARAALSPGQTFSVTLDTPGNVTYDVRVGKASSRLMHVSAAPHSPLWFVVTEPMTLEVVADTGQDLTFCNPGPPTVETAPHR